MNTMLDTIILQEAVQHLLLAMKYVVRIYIAQSDFGSMCDKHYLPPLNVSFISLTDT